jgi:uncharacterized membrane protein
MRLGLSRARDVDAGSAVIAVIAFVLVAIAALVSGSDFHPRDLWPFVLVGSFVPGLSQLLVVRAAQAASASRAGILFGMAPLVGTGVLWTVVLAAVFLGRSEFGRRLVVVALLVVFGSTLVGATH